jgi:hypothetical protein
MRRWRSAIGGRGVALGLAGLLAAGIALRVALLIAWRPGFLGNLDSTLYLSAANVNLFRDQGRPSGYPLFLHVLHGLVGQLSFTVVVQHALGVATALLLFLTLRRVVPAGWGLVPAGVVLLAGPQLFLEHALLSESLFTCAVVAATYCAVRVLDGRAFPWAHLAGALAATAACVRSLGIALPFLLVGWLLLCAPGGWRPRLAVAGTVALCAWLPLAAYVVLAKREAGYVGPSLTRNGGLLLYAGVARFADCAKFTPPPGTRGLCEARPPSQRPGHFWYFLGRGSPPQRTFRTTFFLRPEQDKRLSAFARAAIVHQPLDYLRDTVSDLARYWSSEVNYLGAYDGQTYGAFTESLLGEAQYEAARIASEWYGTGDVATRAGALDALRAYERRTRLEGPAFMALALLACAGLPLARGRRLQVGLLLLGVTLLTVVAPIASSYYEARFAIPGYGPLAASGALGAACIWERLSARRQARRSGSSLGTRHEVPA